MLYIPDTYGYIQHAFLPRIRHTVVNRIHFLRIGRLQMSWVWCRNAI